MARSSMLLVAMAAAIAMASVVAFIAPPGVDSSLRGGMAPSPRPTVAARVEADAEGNPPHDLGLRFGGFVASMFAALVVALMPVAEAQAVRSGGRMGGTAPSAKPPPARAAPRPAEPTTINRTTVINKTTVVAPPPPPPVVVAPAPVMAPAVSPFGMAVAPVVVAPPP
eukprot:CAMPEP_0117545346 /NCGR_PEP_ID=MMETSP0784-20121206/46047_1 /TAXON_ID=39447 /ORGANISM="" /LENGTH=167 /DNA_ID=CAMNT_0005342189 /DNA_START=37 /DNA_END=536 /DNA_ORIENTATION=-